MLRFPRTSGPRLSRRSRPGMRLRIRSLEARLVPSAFATLNVADDLGNLSSGAQAERTGTIALGADVCWYSFTLNSPERIHLSTASGPTGRPLAAVLSLYNSDPFDFADAYDPLQHRLLAQDDSGTHGGNAQIDCVLAPNTYYVAVSGAGNDSFHPLIADSGYPGATGSYTLAVNVSDPGLPVGNSPVVLATNPAAGAHLNHSPFVIRVDLSAPLDPNTVLMDQN